MAEPQESIPYPLETASTSLAPLALRSGILAQAGKIPPQAIQVEQSVLGALLIEKEAIPRAIEILAPGSFYTARHDKIYDAAG